MLLRAFSWNDVPSRVTFDAVSGRFVASCLVLDVVTSGHTQEEAIANLNVVRDLTIDTISQ